MDEPGKKQDPTATIVEFANELAAASDDATRIDGSPSQVTAGMGRHSTGNLGNLDMIMRIPVTMKIVLGSATLPVSALSAMPRGNIISLDRKVGDPADIVVNGRILARGKIVIVNEATGQLGISLSEIVGLSAS